MEPQALFDYYKTHHSVPVPRDVSYLQGMFAIRRLYTSPGVLACQITKATPTRLQFQVRPLSDGAGNLDWIALSALAADVLLFYSRQDMSAAFAALARNYQLEHDQRKAAG